MRVLLVEDDATHVAVLKERLERIPGLTLQLARSRDAANAEIEGGAFDLIICDLKIPTSDGQLDLETEHGESVLALARDRHLGTPVMILSAFGTLDFAVSEVRGAPRLDIVGDGDEISMVDYHTKDHIDKCVDEIERLAQRLRQTDDIEIRRRGAGGDLGPAEARLIKVFGRIHEGRVLEAHRIRGGLSETTTFKLTVNGSQGQLRARAFAKVGPLRVVGDEATRFDRFIVSMLPAGSFATLQRHLKAGAGTEGAIFYQLVGDDPSLFQVLERHPDRGANIVDRLAHNVRPWLEGAPEQVLSVGEIRALVGPPDPIAVMEHLGELNFAVIEAREALVCRAVQHGDLHGENLLVRDGDQPVLIDFGRVRELMAGYDAVTLELSLLFHPSAVSIRGRWPDRDQAEQWDDLDMYLRGCPVPEFVRACRRWAYDTSPSDRAVWACAYGNAMRQLQYPDTDKDLARAIMICAGRVLA